MAIRHGTAAVLAQHHRDGKLLGQRLQRRRRARRQHAAARIDDREAALSDQRGGLLDRGRIRPHAVVLAGRRLDEGDVVRCRQDVRGDLQPDWLRPAAMQLLDGLTHQDGDLRRRRRLRLPLGHAAQDGRLVAHLVEPSHSHCTIAPRWMLPTIASTRELHA